MQIDDGQRELDVFERLVFFHSPAADCRRFVARLGKAFGENSDEVSLRREADEYAATIMFPQGAANLSSTSEPDADIESRRRDVSQAHLERLRETVSYTWGLGIVGAFHQWERDIKDVVCKLTGCPVNQIEKIVFSGLCDKVFETGWDIRSWEKWPHICRANLIANTTKHGDGIAAKKLLKHAPDLFIGGQDAKHLRLSKIQFNETLDALISSWREYQIAYIRREGAKLLRSSTE